MSGPNSHGAPLCRIEDIDDGGSTAFVTELNGQRTSVMAIRLDTRVFLYINSCPHILAPLDFIPGQFLNPAKDKIMCSTHGALFRIDDGQCVFGPCIGKSLTAVPHTVRGGEIWLDSFST